MLKKLLMVSAAAAGMSLVTSAQAAPVLIDDFNDPSGFGQSVFFNHGSGTVNDSDVYTNGAAGIIGGTRSLFGEATYVSGVPFNPGPPPTGAEFANAGVSNNGLFSHFQTSGYRSYTQLTWNANGAGLDDGVNATGFDLTDGSTNTGFVLRVVDADQSIVWSLTLADAGGSSTYFFSNPNNIDSSGTPPTGPKDFYVDFSNFSGIDLFEITSIVFAANVGGFDADPLTQSLTAVDTKVDFIIATPEPEMLALFGMGLLGAGFFSRRKAA